MVDTSAADGDIPAFDPTWNWGSAGTNPYPDIPNFLSNKPVPPLAQVTDALPPTPEDITQGVLQNPNPSNKQIAPVQVQPNSLKKDSDLGTENAGFVGDNELIIRSYPSKPPIDGLPIP